ncbi:MAG: hypothetical protein WDN09_02740 [bacterium]
MKNEQENSPSGAIKYGDRGFRVYINKLKEEHKDVAGIINSPEVHLEIIKKISLDISMLPRKGADAHSNFRSFIQNFDHSIALWSKFSDDGLTLDKEKIIADPLIKETAYTHAYRIILNSQELDLASILGNFLKELKERHIIEGDEFIHDQAIQEKVRESFEKFANAQPGANLKSIAQEWMKLGFDRKLFSKVLS